MLWVSVCPRIRGIKRDAHLGTQSREKVINRLERRKNEIPILNVHLQELQVVCKRGRNLLLLVALDVDVAHCRSRPVSAIVKAQMPVAITVEWNQPMQLKSDVVLVIIPMKIGERRKVRPDAVNLLVRQFVEGIADVSTVLCSQQCEKALGESNSQFKLCLCDRLLRQIGLEIWKVGWNPPDVLW